MSVLDHDVDRTARASSAAPLPGFSNWADSFPDDEVWTLDLDADVRAADPPFEFCDEALWAEELRQIEGLCDPLIGPAPVEEIEDQARQWASEAAGILQMLAQHSADAALSALEVVRDVLQTVTSIQTSTDGRHARHGASMMLRCGVGSTASQSDCIDQISVLEDIKSAAGAVQAVRTEEFRVLRAEREEAAGVPMEKRAKGIGSEIGLARRESSQAGSNAIRMAHTLSTQMPHALAALTDGRLKEYSAGLVVKEVQHLDPAARTAIDEHMAARYGKTGSRRLVGEVRALAQQADPVAYIKAHEIAKTARAVSVRPAPSGMAYLTALLPLGQAFACKKALRDAAAIMTVSDETVARSGAQMEADLLVQRLTGQASPDAINIEVQLVMADESLLGISTAGVEASPGADTGEFPIVDETGRCAEGIFTPAWMPGYGPIPAAIARDMLDPAHDYGNKKRVFLRRILADPVTGEITKIDTRKRLFDGVLRRALILRDEQCRTPWCNAPIAHLDHSHPFALGGRTSAANGTGLCARCNYVKENPGWQHEPERNGRVITTPTGHQYHSQSPPLLPSLTRRI